MALNVVLKQTKSMRDVLERYEESPHHHVLWRHEHVKVASCLSVADMYKGSKRVSRRNFNQYTGSAVA